MHASTWPIEEGESPIACWLIFTSDKRKRKEKKKRKTRGGKNELDYRVNSLLASSAVVVVRRLSGHDGHHLDINHLPLEPLLFYKHLFLSLLFASEKRISSWGSIVRLMMFKELDWLSSWIDTRRRATMAGGRSPGSVAAENDAPQRETAFRQQWGQGLCLNARDVWKKNPSKTPSRYSSLLMTGQRNKEIKTKSNGDKITPTRNVYYPQTRSRSKVSAYMKLMLKNDRYVIHYYVYKLYIESCTNVSSIASGPSLLFNMQSNTHKRTSCLFQFSSFFF